MFKVGRENETAAVRLLLVLLLMCWWPGRSSAQPAPAYDALSDAAIQVKAPAQTALVTITRVGALLYAAGPHGVIVISADNGKSWRQASVPVDLTITELFFTSAREGWAVGHYGVVLHTVDGGLTWTKSLDGLDVIQALDDVAGQAKSATPQTPDAALKLKVATAFHAAGPSKPFLSVGTCDGGILVAGQQDMAMYMAGGGNNWQEWTSKIANPNFKNIYAVLNEGSTTFLIGEEALVLKSSAGCMNFAPLPGPFTGTLFGGLIMSPGTILVYGLDGGVFKSTDDGASWTTIPMPVDASFVTALALKSGAVLLGALNGKMYLSDAQGGSFHQLPVVEPFEVAAMAQAENGNVIVVGNGGVGVVPAASLQ